MKIIDEKGRLFGRINVIDLIVLVVLVLLVGWGIKQIFLKGRPETIYLQYQVCEKQGIYVVNCGDISSYYGSVVSEGDRLYLDGRVIGEVIKRYSVRKYEEDLVNNVLIRTYKLDLRLILKLNVMEKNGIFSIDGEELKLTDVLDINLDKANLRGVITGFEIEKTKKLKKNVTIKIENQPEFIANKIMVNGKEVDDKGKIIAHIFSKKVQGATRELTTETGELVVVSSKLNKDIIIGVQLIAEEQNGELFFHGASLKVGNEIFLGLDDIDVSGEIIEIK